jgi:hypothetical protein
MEKKTSGVKCLSPSLVYRYHSLFTRKFFNIISHPIDIVIYLNHIYSSVRPPVFSNAKDVRFLAKDCSKLSILLTEIYTVELNICTYTGGY